ncbi:MAG: FixH family protein [Pseudomonadota bacterium]
MNESSPEPTARPWYREPWPWIIIGLLGTVVVASLATFWIAASNPDGLVVDDAEYQEIRRGLRAQDTAPANEAEDDVADAEGGG